MKYLRIFRAILKYNFQNDFAYFADSWAGVLSSFTFSIAYVASIKLFMQNTTSIAGYSVNEMLFLAFLSQIQLYLFSSFVFDSLTDMHMNVRSGLIDSILSKPVNLVFYLLFRRISVVKLLRAMPSLLIYAAIISWTSLDLTLSSILQGVLIFLLFVVADYAYLFIVSTKSILHDSPDNAIYSLYYRFHGAGFNLPISAIEPVRLPLLATITPSLVMVFASGAVALNKMPLAPAVALGFISILIILPISYIMWSLAMRKYNSASS